MEKLNELMSKACLASELGKKGITVDLQMLSQIRDEFWALEQRASNLNDGWLNAISERDKARAKLAELAKQEPVAIVARQDPVLLWEWTKLGKRSDTPDGMYLYARPAPAAVPDGWKLVPVEPTAKQWAAGVKAMDSGIDRPTLCYQAMLSAAPEIENAK